MMRGADNEPPPFCRAWWIGAGARTVCHHTTLKRHQSFIVLPRMTSSALYHRNVSTSSDSGPAYGILPMPFQCSASVPLLIDRVAPPPRARASARVMRCAITVVVATT